MLLKKASIMAFVICISLHILLRRSLKRGHVMPQKLLLARMSANPSLELGISSNAEDQGYNLPWRLHDMDLPNATACVKADILFPGRPLGGAL